MAITKLSYEAIIRILRREKTSWSTKAGPAEMMRIRIAQGIATHMKDVKHPGFQERRFLRDCVVPLARPKPKKRREKK